MTEHVTQDQFNTQLILIHQSIRDSNARTEKHLAEMSASLVEIAKESANTRGEILTIVKSHETRLDNHSERITGAEQSIVNLTAHKIKTAAYWMIFGSVSSIILAAAVAKIFG